VCLAQHRAVSGPEADSSVVSLVQASWRARPQAETWLSRADRCAAEHLPKERLPVAGHARNARARARRRAACQPAASLSGRQSAEPGAQQVLPPAASVLSAPRVGEAAEEAAPLAQRPAGAARVAAAVEAVVPHGAVAGEEAPHVAGGGAAEVPHAAEAAAEERQAVREPRAAERPLAAVPSSPSRLRSAPARRSMVRMRFARAPRRLRTATPTARSWQAARDEVWSW
jgi:hypothetical protein